MKKKYVALIIFTTIGIGLSLAGAIGLNFNFSSVTAGAEFKEIEEKYSLIKNEEDMLNINVSSSKVQIVKSSSDEIEVTYVSDEAVLVYEENLLSFVPKIKFDYWYNPFTTLSSQYEIKIGLPENGYKHLNIYANASTLSISEMEFASINLKSSACDIKLESIVVDELDFSISACSLNAKLMGIRDDYFVDIKTSMGSCNINENNNDPEKGYSKSITGLVNTSSAIINFA